MNMCLVGRRFCVSCFPSVFLSPKIHERVDSLALDKVVGRPDRMVRDKLARDEIMRLVLSFFISFQCSGTVRGL